MIDYYNNETRLTEILRAVVNSSTIDLGPARTREEIFVSRALGLTMWPAIPPRTTMEMWLAFIAGDAAEPAAGSYTVRTCAESCIITYARRVRGASAVVPIFAPHTHYERALAKLAGIVPLNWGVLGREWEHLMQTITVSTMPRSAVAVIGGERVSVGPGGEISPFQDLRGYGYPWPGGGGENKFFVNESAARSNCIDSASEATGVVSVADVATAKWSTPYIGYSDVIAGKTYTISGGPLKYGRIGGSTRASGQPSGSSIPDVDIGTTIQSAITNATASRTFKANTSQRIYWYYCTDAGISNHQAFDVQPVVVEGSTAGTWSPYSNICHIYPGLTLVRDNGSQLAIWGGALEMDSGALTVTDAEIAKYAGETLPGEWISDRNAYAAGAVPTTGAQVVYKLTDPITYQLTRAEVQRALNCSNYLGAGVWRLSCGGVTIIRAQIRTESLVNHYDIAASNENWTFEVMVDGVTVSGASGSISVAAGDHDVVIVATPGEDTGVCIIQPTLYYTAVAGLLGSRQDQEELEEPVEPEPEEPEPEEPEPEEPEPEEPAEPEPETKRRRAK